MNKPIITAGQLRHSVYYESVSQGPPSPYGDSAQVWTRIAELWSCVEFLEGKELMQAKQVHDDAKARITIRYNPIVTATGRFVFEGENLYPTSVIADTRKIKMTCICSARPQENV